MELDRGTLARIDRKLLAGLESGEPIEVTPEYWEKKKQELRARHRAENE